jgi:hypothetical protein
LAWRGWCWWRPVESEITIETRGPMAQCWKLNHHRWFSEDTLFYFFEDQCLWKYGENYLQCEAPPVISKLVHITA